MLDQQLTKSLAFEPEMKPIQRRGRRVSVVGVQSVV